MAKKRRLFLLSAVAVTSGIVAAAACSFPEPRVVPDEGGASDDGTTDTSSGGPDGTDGDGGGLLDVVEPDSRPPIDATSEKPAVEAGCVCDCDEDGFIAVDAASACDAGGKQRDCDDFDRRAFPDAGYSKELPTKDTQGDWNCDTFTNREVKSVNVNCAALSTALPNSCSGAEGFVGDPGCGAQATYVKCAVVGTVFTKCEAVENLLATQGCK